ncbi:MAG: coenzyme-B sulfoethylthiotransferase subunit beta [Candidatus Helarchaeota archaeon]
MKYKDVFDLYSDTGECIAEDVPLEAISPMYNPYLQKILETFNSTAFIDLEKVQNMFSRGRAGHTTSVRQDEVQMRHYSRKLPIIKDAKEIAERIKDIIEVVPINGHGNGEPDTEVRLFNNNKSILVKMSKERMRLAAGRAPVYTVTGLAFAQAISELYDITPETDPDACAFLKNVVFGRYPQMVTFQPGNPVSSFLIPPMQQEGIGLGYRGITINHIVALANKRTFDAVALTSVLEQGCQFETGNAIGWYERYCLLGFAYQGLNADCLVLDLIEENGDGTVGNVIHSLMKHALEDGVIMPRGDTFPDVQTGGYRLYKTPDFPLWNAYSCAGLLAACMVNVGASRAAQCVSAVLAGFGDLLAFESGGLPDPDCGRIMGTGLGFCFYTHSIYGGAGPGAFPMNHVLVKHTSGFFTPCVAAAMCLDAGTQIFGPETTSKSFFTIRNEFEIFHNPLQKIAEAALEVKKKLR